MSAWDIEQDRLESYKQDAINDLRAQDRERREQEELDAWVQCDTCHLYEDPNKVVGCEDCGGVFCQRHAVEAPDGTHTCKECIAKLAENRRRDYTAFLVNAGC